MLDEPPEADKVDQLHVVETAVNPVLGPVAEALVGATSDERLVDW